MTPEDSRTISDDLKDRVWRRDREMCQANYKLDSRFDKNTGGDLWFKREFGI